MNNRAQAAIEFLVLTGFMFIVFSTFFLVVQERTSSMNEHALRQELTVVAEIIEQEVQMAQRVRPGYSRTFEIPTRILGEEYNVTLFPPDNPSELIVEHNGKEYIIFLQVNLSPNSNISPGYNYITRDDYNISLGPGDEPPALALCYVPEDCPDPGECKESLCENPGTPDAECSWTQDPDGTHCDEGVCSLLGCQDCDVDGDGFEHGDYGCEGRFNGPDCNDADGTIYPGAPEICGDGISQNCDYANECLNPVCADICASIVAIRSACYSNSTEENLLVSTTLDGDRYMYNFSADGMPMAIGIFPFDVEEDFGQGPETRNYAEGEVYYEVIQASHDPGVVGMAYDIDGNDRGVKIDGLEQNLNLEEGTITAWINLEPTTAADGVYRGVVEFGNTAESNKLIALRVTNQGGLMLRYQTPAKSMEAIIVEFNDTYVGEWAFVVGQWNATDVGVFVNGEVFASAKREHSLAPGDLNQAYIGLDAQVAPRNEFDGLIDEVRIYNRAISAGQMQLLKDLEYHSLSSAETVAGEDWSACVTPILADEDQDTWCTDDLTVLAIPTSCVPGEEYVTIQTACYQNSSDENLIASTTLLGDSYVYDFSVDGLPFAHAIFPFDVEEDQSGRVTRNYAEDNGYYEVIGASHNPGYAGNAYDIDGDERGINITGLEQGLNLEEGTIAAWIKLAPEKAADGIAMGIVEFGSSSVSNKMIVLRLSSAGNLNMRYKTPETTMTASILEFNNTYVGEWAFVVGMWNATNLSVFVDGTEYAAAPRTFSLTQGDLDQAYIGLDAQTTPTNEFDGLIDEVRIYNRALSAKQMQLLKDLSYEEISYEETKSGEDWSVCVTPVVSSVDQTTHCSVDLEILPVRVDCGGPDVETDCTDGVDNDGDDYVDCADSDCDLQACGMGIGATCQSEVCTENICNDGLDNDEDGTGDYDGSLFDPMIPGDSDCPVELTNIVSENGAQSEVHLTVACTVDVANIRSVEATLDGSACEFSMWNEKDALFQCEAPRVTAQTSVKTAECEIDTSISAATGTNPRTKSVTVCGDKMIDGANNWGYWDGSSCKFPADAVDLDSWQGNSCGMSWGSRVKVSDGRKADVVCDNEQCGYKDRCLETGTVWDSDTSESIFGLGDGQSWVCGDSAAHVDTGKSTGFYRCAHQPGNCEGWSHTGDTFTDEITGNEFCCTEVGESQPRFLPGACE